MKKVVLVLSVVVGLFLNVACENQMTTPVNPPEVRLQKSAEGGIVVVVQGRTIQVNTNSETGSVFVNLKNSGNSVYEDDFIAPQVYEIDARGYNSGNYTLEVTIGQNEVEVFQVELL